METEKMSLRDAIMLARVDRLYPNDVQLSPGLRAVARQIITQEASHLEYKALHLRGLLP